MPSPDLAHPIFVVLGATGSVGSEVCRRLVASGGRIVIGGRDPKSLEELAVELDVPRHSVEARNLASIETCLESAVESYGRLDGVVNCMGTVLLKPADRTSDDEWNHTIEVNLTSAFAVVRTASRLMRRSGGSVVLVSSAAARIGLANHEAIAAAKAGIIGLTLSAAATYANRQIRFNAVAPGLVRSKMTKSLCESSAAAAMSQSMHAIGRLGEPADVAAMIEWLLQPANCWITGQVFGVDGGLSTVAPKIKATL